MNETSAEREHRRACENLFEAWRKLLPDSRLRNRSISFASPIGQVQPVFCLNCGRSQGAVTKDPTLPEHTVLFICPSCAATHGGLPVPEIPEELLRRPRQED